MQESLKVGGASGEHSSCDGDALHLTNAALGRLCTVQLDSHQRHDSVRGGGSGGNAACLLNDAAVHVRTATDRGVTDCGGRRVVVERTRPGTGSALCMSHFSWLCPLHVR